MVAPEVPDWTRPVSVMGKDSEGNPVTVLLDSLGRLICVLYGAITLSGPVDVTQVDSTREIQGADGVTLHTIAVDSEGRIIAIVKGEYAGTLKNLAVDSEGRMIMIPTDPADIWGNAISMGNAELAAVLGAAKKFDRRGQVFFIDSFDNGFDRWTSEASGTGADILLSSGTHRTGGFSVNLVGGSDTLRFAGLIGTFALVSLGKLGIELSYNIYIDVEYVYLYLIYYDGINALQSGLRYDPVNKTLSYLNSGGTWTQIATGLTTPYIKGAFFTTKLVVDFTTQKYVRALFNEKAYDISTTGVYKPLDNTGPYLFARIRVTSTSGNNGRCWVDDVIFTQNEPA